MHLGLHITINQCLRFIKKETRITDQNTTEHPFFHFNEALFKPFENLVCLELADVDVQDQIVTSICDFVETNTAEINSGWRSLFGALKGVHFPVEIRDGCMRLRMRNLVVKYFEH